MLSQTYKSNYRTADIFVVDSAALQVLHVVSVRSIQACLAAVIYVLWHCDS